MRSSFARLRVALFAGFAVLTASHAVRAENFATLYTFQGNPDGANPVASVLFVNGSLYGTTIGGGQGAGTAFQLAPPATQGGAWKASVLHDFAADGTHPFGGLTPFKTSFLGTTFNDSLSGNGGVAYRLKPPATPGAAWKEASIYSFGNAGDGWGPMAGLTKLGQDYYGATLAGGTAGCTGYTGGPDGCGTILKLTPPVLTGGNWTENVVYRFNGGGDGAVVPSDLLDVKGTLYGVTTFGGSGMCNTPNASAGCGTLFAITPQGVKTILYSFTGGSDGALPAGKLIYVQGAFYGTTSSGGGTGCGGSGCGTLFRLKRPAVPGGPWREKVIHAFAGGSDGAGPMAGLVNLPTSIAGLTTGTLYGTTVLGGGTGCGGNGCGTVFKIPLSGVESVVHAFQGGADGAYPIASLINNSGGLIGTTEFGGTSTCPGGKTVASYQGCGTVFEISQ